MRDDGKSLSRRLTLLLSGPFSDSQSFKNAAVPRAASMPRLSPAALPRGLMPRRARVDGRRRARPSMTGRGKKLLLLLLLTRRARHALLRPRR